MNAPRPYAYARSVKSDLSDELINRSLIRPLAGIVVRLCYPTRVTPNQLTAAAILAGLCCAAAFFPGSPSLNALAGVFLFLKDLLDSADGQLARARNQFTRLGRFLDSIGDVVVNIAVFVAIGLSLSRAESSLRWMFLAAAAFACLTLRVSYHVFYQTSFLHLQHEYEGNRTTEEFRPEDLREDRWTVRLQRMFLAIYGWQDAMMVRLDRWCRRGKVNEDDRWFGDRTGIRWSGLLGLGTENMTLVVFSLFDALPYYLLFNLIVANTVWVGCILYRRALAGKIAEGGMGEGERKNR